MINEHKKGGVPVLRFPEFREAGEWEVPTLGEISERITKKVGDKKLTTVSITAGVGFVSQAEKFSRDISGQQYKNYILLKKGEFAYNKGNSKKFPQGCIYKLKEFEQVAAPNAFISFRFKEKYVSDFYQGYFDSNFHGKQLLKYITSGARSDGLLNINPNDFFSIKLPTPIDKTEQEKIAACLSSLDELITAQAQKVEALKTHKKGLMQQLFPAMGETMPKLRFKEFSGDWKAKKLKDFIHSHKGGAPLTPSDFVESGCYEVIPKKAISSGGKLLLDKNNPTYCEKIFFENHTQSVVDSSYLITTLRDLVPSGPSIGYIVKFDGVNKYLLAQGVYGIKFKGDILEDFVIHYSNTDSYRVMMQKIMVGSTQVHIRNGVFFETKISVPTFSEQQKIAACLSSLDELITAQAQKVEALKTHKKGLMQQLFPSNELGEQ